MTQLGTFWEGVILIVLGIILVVVGSYFKTAALTTSGIAAITLGLGYCSGGKLGRLQEAKKFQGVQNLEMRK